MAASSIPEQLKQIGLKVTPQRIAIYEAVIRLKGHPTAEKIIDHVKSSHPNISTGTVYKTLDSLVENKLLEKIKTDKDRMRYDAEVSHHHHLYCSESDRVEDYEDEQLDQLMHEYFEKKKIKNFKIQDIKLQITGKFNKKTKS